MTLKVRIVVEPTELLDTQVIIDFLKENNLNYEIQFPHNGQWLPVSEEKTETKRKKKKILRKHLTDKEALAMRAEAATMQYDFKDFSSLKNTPKKRKLASKYEVSEETVRRVLLGIWKSEENRQATNH